MQWRTRLFRRHGRYDDLSVSIREHIAERADELVDQGVPQAEAEQAARREFGNVGLIEQRSREAWQWLTLESILFDVRFAVRQLIKAPGFTVAAVLTLGLGIAVNASMFSVVSGFLLPTLPGRDPQSLVVVSSVLLSVNNLLGGQTLQLLKDSEAAEKDITKQLYAEYKETRTRLIREVMASIDAAQPLRAVRIAQTILDRVLFIAFAEDKGLLTKGTLKDAYTTKNHYSPQPAWENFKGLFNAIDKGNPRLNIPGYNGGLFAHDDEIDALSISEETCKLFADLGEYDYDSEVSVNILGSEVLRDPLVRGDEGQVASFREQIAAEFQKGDIQIPIAFCLAVGAGNVFAFTRPRSRHSSFGSGLGMSVDVAFGKMGKTAALTTGTNIPVQIMEPFSPQQVPVISALARNYAICDEWFCSVPSETWPNRSFVHAGTSNAAGWRSRKLYRTVQTQNQSSASGGKSSCKCLVKRCHWAVTPPPS